jgi:hypothetical protein
MALGIFIDGLPYSELKSSAPDWLRELQLAPLRPNIGYSSALHWQLCCDRYPDDRGRLTDWVRTPEQDRKIVSAARLLAPLDAVEPLALLTKKGLDRLVFRRNAFANIPFAFRPDFSEQGDYLFRDSARCAREPLFAGYTVISQDEGLSFAETMRRLNRAIARKERRVFAAFGFADAVGHGCRRGPLYRARLSPYLQAVGEAVQSYRRCWPDEEIVLFSDHGMSTVRCRIDLRLEQQFGRQGRDRYIAYCDSCLLCVWSEDERLREALAQYLAGCPEGHLLTEADRGYYRVTDRRFGDLLYNLREGSIFSGSWFGRGLRPHPDGEGMHGFWPEPAAEDQLAAIVLGSSRRQLGAFYSYPQAHRLLLEILQEEKRDGILP